MMLFNQHNILGCSLGMTFTIPEEIHDSSHEGMVLLGVRLLFLFLFFKNFFGTN
jgi:hypothetical protein